MHHKSCVSPYVVPRMLCSINWGRAILRVPNEREKEKPIKTETPLSWIFFPDRLHWASDVESFVQIRRRCPRCPFYNTFWQSNTYENQKRISLVFQT